MSKRFDAVNLIGHKNNKTRNHKDLAATLSDHAISTSLRPRTFNGPDVSACRLVGRFCHGVICFFLRWRAGLFKRSRYQIITGSRAIEKRKDVVVRGALADDFNAPFILQAGQLAHHKILLCDAHVAVIDVEREARGVWRRIDCHGIPIHSSQ